MFFIFILSCPSTPTVQNDTLLILCAHSRYSLRKYFDISDCFHTASMDESFIMHITKVLSAKLKIISIFIYNLLAKKTVKIGKTPHFYFTGFLSIHSLIICSQLHNPLFLQSFSVDFFGVHKNAFCIHIMHSSIGDASPTYKIPFAELYQTR